MRRALVLVVLALSAVVWRSAPAAAVSTDVTAAPRVAPTGTPVRLSGQGCGSTVHIVVTGILPPSPPVVTADDWVTPDLSGRWEHAVAMPPVPAYVLASCDGPASLPVVIAPTDVEVGSIAPAAVTADGIEVTTSPLVDGSELAVLGESGSSLGSSIVAGGSATVVVPRAAGPASVLVLGLRARDPGIALPYVPIARRLQLPLRADPVLTADPRVAPIGAAVTLSGSCAGAPAVVVNGRPDGWYDIPPEYARIVPPGSGDAFSTVVPMPDRPATVRLTCSAGGTIAERTTSLAPTNGDLVPVVPAIDGDAATLTLPSALPGNGLDAFTATGAAAPLQIVASGATTVRVILPVGTLSVVVLGWEALGENANARQVVRVQGWTAAIDGTPPTVPPTALGPADSTQSPVSSPEVSSPGVSSPSAPPPLPATGGSSWPAAVAAGTLLLAGVTLVRSARRRLPPP